jgi:uncharacterized membrane protein
MLWGLLKALHVLAVLIWVGGMAFAQFVLRPSLAVLEPPQRLRLMHAVLGRFLAIVLVAVGVVLLTGAALIGRVSPPPWDWLVMATVGLLMMALFGHIRLVLWKRLDRAVQGGDAPAAAAALAAIRRWVGVNLVLGLALVALVVAF